MPTLSLRPFYFPREFPTVVISCVYITPSSNIRTAAEIIAKDTNALLTEYPSTLLFILGDFNNCRQHCVLPSLQKCVDIPTRRDNILDLCYGNITDALCACSYPPLTLADQKVFCLLPLYQRELRRHKTHTATVPHTVRRTPFNNSNALIALT